MELSKAFKTKLEKCGVDMGHYTNVGYNGKVYTIRRHEAGAVNCGMWGRYQLIFCAFDNNYNGYTPVFFNN